MAVKFNPFTGQLQIDQVGAGGGGSAFFAGEVATYADLPLDGSAPLNSRWLVRSNSGTWPFSTYKQAGIYIRTATGGTDRDADYDLTDTSFHDVMSDDAFLIFDNTDPTKAAKFDVGANVSAGQTRVISVPDKNITLDDAGDSRAPSSHSSSHAAAGSDPLFDQNLNTTDNAFFNNLETENNVIVGGDLTIVNALVVGANGLSLQNSPTETTDLTTLATGVRSVSLPDASGTLALVGDAPASHAHGNITNGGLVGTTANLPLKTGTGGIVEAGVFGTGAGEFAEGNDARITGAIQASTVDAKGDLLVGTADNTIARLAVGGTNGHVLTVDSAEASGMKWAAASGGGVSAVDATTADVLSVSGSDLVADDGGTIDSADPFIKWDDTAGKLVYANPLSRPSGAFYVGLAPTTTALGANAINIQATRNAAQRIASGSSSICIGTGNNEATASESIAIGVGNAVSGARATGIGYAATASGAASVCITGLVDVASGVNSVGINGSANLRAQFATRPFSAIYWSGQTTNDTATILNLDGTATNRFTIAANTALAVDILLVARRSDTADKWLVARRFLGIRRDGSNNTSLIGSVQTLGTDQTDGSPTWSFTLTADDTNEALQLEVTGAASETVQWRATAFYRVV